MTDFAPGNWHARRDTFSVYSNFGRSVVKVADTRQKLFTPECQVANARLIAAAPDLLEIAYLLLEMANAPNPMGQVEIKHQAIALAKAAILKAQGE